MTGPVLLGVLALLGVWEVEEGVPGEVEETTLVEAEAFVVDDVPALDVDDFSVVLLAAAVVDNVFLVEDMVADEEVLDFEVVDEAAAERQPRS